MTATPLLALPFIDAAQAQKHVTHNEALSRLDAVVMLSVIDRDLSAPPPSPSDGDRYLVHTPGSGDFAGEDDHVAVFADGGWTFIAPQTGWTCYVADDDAFLVWDGSAWKSAVSSLQNLLRLGVGTTADATNPFAAKLNNALWTATTLAESGTGDLRYKLNKEAAANTLSLLLQTGFSGRAEIGLTGDDDVHFKVSADGASWIDALRIDRASGAAACLDLDVGRALRLSGAVTPPLITADQNDYDPAGLATASVLRLGTDAPRTITGLAQGTAGRVLLLINVGPNAITLSNANASSAASNRFSLGSDVGIAANRTAVLWYDATDNRWRLLALS